MIQIVYKTQGRRFHVVILIHTAQRHWKGLYPTYTNEYQTIKETKQEGCIWSSQKSKLKATPSSIPPTPRLYILSMKVLKFSCLISQIETNVVESFPIDFSILAINHDIVWAANILYNNCILYNNWYMYIIKILQFYIYIAPIQY